MTSPPAAPRYDRRGLLGTGSAGMVELVRDARLDREVARKTLRTDLGRRPAAASVARFLQEARITARLEHPGIIPVHDIGQDDDGAWYYTMPVVRGRTLKDRIAQASGLAGRLALLPHFVELCQALAYAHAQGIVHRDLKPANVMIGEFGETQILDWGLAKAHGEAHLRDGELAQLGASEATLIGSILGTPSTMSPEQAWGRVDEVDARSDVWSLGAILFEILVGRPPFSGPDAWAVVEQVRREEPPRVRDITPEAPRELDAIVARALTRDRQGRYAEAMALAHDVNAWMTGAQVEAYAYSPSERLRRILRPYRMPLTVALGALVVVTAVVAGAFRTVVSQRDRAVAAERRLDRSFGELATERATAAFLEGRYGEADAYAGSVAPSPALTGLLAGAGAAGRPTRLLAPSPCETPVAAPWPTCWARDRFWTSRGGQWVPWAGTQGLHAPARVLPDGTLIAGTTTDGLSERVMVTTEGLATPLGWSDVRGLAASPSHVARLDNCSVEAHPLGGLAGPSSDRWRICDAGQRGGAYRNITWSPSLDAWVVAVEQVDLLVLRSGGQVEHITPEPIHTWTAVQSLGDGRLLLGSSADQVMVWSPGQSGQTLGTPGGTLRFLQARGDQAVSQDQLGHVQWWDLDRLTSVAELDAGLDGDLVSWGAQVALARKDGVAAWSPPDPSAWSSATAPFGLTAAVALPGGVFVGGAEGLRGFVGDHSRWRDTPADPGVIRTASLTGDGRWVVVAFQHGQVAALDPTTLEIAHAVDHEAYGVAAVPGEAAVYVGDRRSGHAAIRRWDIGGPAEPVATLDHLPRDLCVGRSGRLAVSHADGGVLWLDPSTGQVLSDVEAEAHDVACHPDGRVLVPDGPRLRWWDPDHTGLTSPDLPPAGGIIDGLAISADGRLIATASRDSRVRVFDVSSGAVVLDAPGHSDVVVDVAFGPEGRWLYSVSWDRTVRRWDLDAIDLRPADARQRARHHEGFALDDGKLTFTTP